MKKLLALLLALVMVISMVACGEKTPAAETPKDETPKTETPKDETPTDAPVEALEEYELVYYMAGDPQADEELVEQAINEYLKDTLNIKLDIVMVPFGDFDEKFRVAVGSGEQIDVTFTSGWCNDFIGNISRNALLPLNDLLPAYAAETLAQMPDVWGSVTVNGNIYAVPNEQAWPYQSVLAVDTAAVEEYGWDLSNIKSIADLEPFLAEYKADHPDSYPLYAGSETSFGDRLTMTGYEVVEGTADICNVKIDDETCTVVKKWEIDEAWNVNLNIRKAYLDKGYVRPDTNTLGGIDPMDIATGKSIMRTDGTYKPGMEALIEAQYEKDMTVVTIGYDPILIGGGISATTLAIPVTSKNPERAMMFINACNTDPVLYNLLCFGIEGTHYTLDGNCATTVEGSGWNPNADWAYGCQFNAYTRPGQDANVWEETRAYNAAATPSVLMGFTFNPEPVKNEIAACSAVGAEYNSQLGMAPTHSQELMDKAVAALEAAGADAIVAECQKQINEWMAANGK